MSARFISPLKVYFPALLLTGLFTKITFFESGISDALAFCCLAVLTGWQVYLSHLRIQKLHQKQIDSISRDLAHVKAVVQTMSMVNQAKVNLNKNNPLGGFTWTEEAK